MKKISNFGRWLFYGQLAFVKIFIYGLLCLGIAAGIDQLDKTEAFDLVDLVAFATCLVVFAAPLIASQIAKKDD